MADSASDKLSEKFSNEAIFDPKELKAALQCVIKAGSSTLQSFGGRVHAEHKSDGSPVTAADKRAEEILRGEISKIWPDDTVIGEEFAAEQGKSGRSWIIDPIDGTRSFVSGVPLYTTLLGLHDSEGWACGIIYAPALGQIVYAGRGGGCFGGEVPNPKKGSVSGAAQIEVSRTSSLKDATVVTSGPEYLNDHINTNTHKKTSIYRTWGDGYGYMLLASGRVDAVIDNEMSIWDIAALFSVVEEAGGEITDWQGQKIEGGFEGGFGGGGQQTQDSYKIIATNKLITSELAGIIGK